MNEAYKELSKFITENSSHLRNIVTGLNNFRINNLAIVNKQNATVIDKAISDTVRSIARLNGIIYGECSRLTGGRMKF